jgi:hypothetical protein
MTVARAENGVRAFSRLRGAALAAALAFMLVAFFAGDARAGDTVDDARSAFLPEFHGAFELHQTTLPPSISLCAPYGQSSCSHVRDLAPSEYGGGKVTHGAYDLGIDFLGVGPLRFGLGALVGFGDGPDGTLGGDATAPGSGLRTSSLWKAVGGYGIIALRLKGEHWAGYVELMPTAIELYSDVSGAYPALRADTTVGMLSGRVGFTVPVSRLLAIGPSFGAGTSFRGDGFLTDVNGGIRVELRMNQVFAESSEEKAQREEQERRRQRDAQE